MVATRRGTRVEPLEEGERSAAEQTPEKVISPTSPMQTRRSVKKYGQIGESLTDDGKPVVTSRSPLKSDTVKHITQVTTRSRHRSGQSDADVSEAESTSSSTWRSSSTQSLGLLTNSTRKLRSHQSALIAEPIIESKEGAELSEAESYCSSVSTTARKKRPGTASRSVSIRSRKSLFLSKPTSDASEEESNSSISGVKIITTRSTRNSTTRHLSSPVREPHKDAESDAESCCSGFSSQPLARRSSRRNLQSDEVVVVNKTNKDDAQDQDTLKKQSPKIDSVKSNASSSVGEQNVLSSPCRSSQTQKAIQEDEVIIVSDDEPESSDAVNKDLNVEELEVEKSSVTKDVNIPVETSAVSSIQTSETQPEENILPCQMLSEGSMREEPAVEKSHVTNDKNATEETNENLQDVLKSTNMDESMNLCLYIDSDDSEKSEHSDDDLDDENNMAVEEQENHEPVVEKQKSKKASTQQLQNVAGDGLFVIDTTPGVDSSKKYFLEPDDCDDGDKEDETIIDEKMEMARPDDDDDDFIDKDEDEDQDEEEALVNRPKCGFVLSTNIDTGINLKEMGGLYINFDAEKPNPGPSLLSKMKKGNKKKDELLQKSVITPDFEKKESVPPYKESLNKLKKLRKEERDKSTGRGWFDMKAPDLTDELKNDLKALKMRSAMDPKHFYKKNDRDGFPKYFQVGTVVDSPVDFYHSRIPKKQRKRTIMEELLADSEFRRYNKKKFKEIMYEKAARAEGKKNRKKKKFQT